MTGKVRTRRESVQKTLCTISQFINKSKIPIKGRKAENSQHTASLCELWSVDLRSKEWKYHLVACGVYSHVCESHFFENNHPVWLSIFVWKSSLITNLLRICIHCRLIYNTLPAPCISIVKLILPRGPLHSPAESPNWGARTLCHKQIKTWSIFSLASLECTTMWIYCHGFCNNLILTLTFGFSTVT